MTDLLETAQQQLLAPGGLDLRTIEQSLDRLMAWRLDAADLYFQASAAESWSLEDGIVKQGSFNRDQGVGVRAIRGERSGFAYTEEILPEALLQASQVAGSIAQTGGQHQGTVWQPTQAKALYSPLNPIQSLSAEEKIALLHRVDAAARAYDPAVSQVMVSLAASHETILVAAADGTLAADVRPLVRLSVNVIAERNQRREQGSAGCGGRDGYASVENRAVEMAQAAAQQAITNLDAVDAPAGEMPVVLGPGWPGVLLHEAVGHGLEGDFNRKGTSAYAGRIGEQVASSLCTIVDDGTLAQRRGSLSIDDEGEATRCNTLIENGILRGYMQDKMNARLMGVPSTGNGRRESFAHLPMPRMTNTYMLPGESDPAELIASVEKGLYAVNFGGGQVDITSGQFVFSASEAYLIENGKIGQPVRGATLIGNGPAVLNQVSMVGNDLKLDEGIGVCGKDGQSVPVGVGQPSLKIDALTVGGTA